MINLEKQREYLDPLTDIKSPIHIIGIGAIGSTIATMLARMGIENLYLYDFDTVESKNVCNQEYFARHTNATKLASLTEILLEINPQIKVNAKLEGWKPGTKLSGYIFLCVDNIDLRREIVKENEYNQTIKGFFDFRMRLTDAQHYACTKDTIPYLLSTMNFTHEEAQTETPTSACGTSLNVITTVKTICSLGLQNFINLIKKDTLKKCILIDLDTFLIDFID